MKFEGPFIKKVQKVANVAKIGVASLLITNASLGQNQENKNLDKNIDKIENKIDIQKEVFKMKPSEVYKLYSPDKILDSMFPEDFKQKKIDLNKEDNNPDAYMWTPLEKQIEEIEKEAGFKRFGNNAYPQDFESEGEFIKEYVKGKLDYQNKIGKEIQEIKNKYSKGKFEDYKKKLSKFNKEEFKGGYLLRNDGILNSLMNQYYSPNEAEEYEQDLKDYIEDHKDKGSFDEFDLNFSLEELKKQAKEIWNMSENSNQELESDKNPES